MNDSFGKLLKKSGELLSKAGSMWDMFKLLGWLIAAAFAAGMYFKGNLLPLKSTMAVSEPSPGISVRDIEQDKNIAITMSRLDGIDHKLDRQDDKLDKILLVVAGDPN